MQFVKLCVLLSAAAVSNLAQAQATSPELLTTVKQPSVLVGDFVGAMDIVASHGVKKANNAGEQLWADAFAERGIDPAFLAKRLSKARTKSADPFGRFRSVNVEIYAQSNTELVIDPVALHGFQLDVVEDYDDVTNDDVYGYFITTHDDMLWGKVTDIYTGLDEGTSVFMSAKDRGIFGPQGDKIVPRNHTIVDFGLVESDSGDIAQLQKISDAIVDLALVALTIYDPNAGAAAAQARAETQNLLRLVIGMDDDDRLVTDSLHFTPDSMMTTLAGTTVSEFDRFYEAETFWTHFAYRFHWRLLK